MSRFFFILQLSILLFYFNVNAQERTLEDYITSGLKSSPLLKDYNNQLLSLSYDSLIVKAGGIPQVNIGSQAMYAPAGKNFGYDSAITNGGNYSAMVSVGQSLSYGKIRATQYRAIDLLQQTLHANTLITTIDLKKNITAQFLSAFADQSLLQFDRSVLGLFQDQLNVLNQLVQKGVYLQTDYLNLTVSIRSQEIAIEEVYIQFKNNLGLLNFTCGLADTANVILKDPHIEIHNDMNIENSPLMMQLKIDSMRNISNRDIIDLNYRPRLNAFADAGFNSINPKNIPYNIGASIGLNFTMPVYDGKQRKQQYKKIDISENTRTILKEFYSIQFKQQILQFKEQLRLTDVLISDIKDQIQEQRKLIDMYKLEIEKGLVRFIDFITIVNNYSMTKYNLTQAEINRMQIINQMNYLK